MVCMQTRCTRQGNGSRVRRWRWCEVLRHWETRGDVTTIWVVECIRHIICGRDVHGLLCAVVVRIARSVWTIDEVGQWAPVTWHINVYTICYVISTRKAIFWRIFLRFWEKSKTPIMYYLYEIYHVFISKGKRTNYKIIGMHIHIKSEQINHPM